MPLSDKKLFGIAAILFFITGVIVSVFEYVVLLPILRKEHMPWNDIVWAIVIPLSLFLAGLKAIIPKSAAAAAEERRELLKPPGVLFVAVLLLSIVVFVSIIAAIVECPDCGNTIARFFNKP